MMSKASFMMQDYLRRSYVMITDISNPNTFFVRGRLPFPQGLTALAVLFKNKRPADVYAHPYFIEKQSDPSQSSPQLHLTEESQGIIKVVSGLRYMRDDNTKLDNTMVVVTDYKVEVEGRMPRVPAVMGNSGPYVGASQPVETAEDKALAKRKATLSLEQRAMLRRSTHHVQQVPGGGGDTAMGMGGMRNPIAPSGAAGAGGEMGGGGAASTEQAAMAGYSTFPTPEECAVDAWVVYRYLKAALYGRRALKEEEEESPTHRINAPALFEHRAGGYTVLYNPIEVNERTFAELFLKLEREERVVKAIVVPTRPAWRHLQVWADAFPDAELISSGDVPLVRSRGGVPNPKPSAAHATPAAAIADGVHATDSGGGTTDTAGAEPPGAWRGGCQDLGSGLTGLSFPEVDLEAEAAAERQRAEAAAEKARATAAAVHLEQAERQQQERYQQSLRHAVEEGAATSSSSSSSSSSDPYAAQRRRQEEKVRLRQEVAAEEAAEARQQADRVGGDGAPSAADDGAEGDLVDVLWRDVSFFAEKAQQPVGLRESDADRLRVLSPRSAEAAPVDCVELTPTIELLRIAGDAATEEYVLYDANSRCLACTDLFHGGYSDLDPANSWMCRVWFKFMKRGDYKRTDLAPRYKWLQVLQQRSLHVLQNAIEQLTRTRPIDFVVFSHGTPPLDGNGVNLLRQQWSLAPLHPAELPRDPRGSPLRAKKRRVVLFGCF